jgi:hypothetical protein
MLSQNIVIIPCIASISKLASFENIDGVWADFCMVHVQEGIESTSSSLRALSLLVLLALVGDSPDAIARVLDLVVSVAKDTSFWEVRALTVLFLERALFLLPMKHPRIELVYATVNTILRDPSSLHVSNIAISTMASATTHHPVLCAPVVHALLAMPKSARQQLLGLQGPVTPLHGITMKEYELKDVTSVWNALGVASEVSNAIAEAVHKKNAKVIDASIEVLRVASKHIDTRHSALWLDIFNSIGENHLAILFHSGEHIDAIKEILSHFSRIPALAGVTSFIHAQPIVAK